MNESELTQKINADFEDLLQNLIDVVQEEQIKIGYRKEVIRLYYPLKSVNNLLGIDVSSRRLINLLKDFIEFSREKLGDIEFLIENERLCFVIPEVGVEFIHNQIEDKSFLKEFIEIISHCQCGISQIESVFNKYSNSYQCERVDNNEFDYLLYFTDGKPDRYMYCIKFEEDHVIYHRFTRKDYEDFNF